MPDTDLARHYRRYLDCLNARRFDDLDAFVADTLHYNGKPLTRADYRKLIADSIVAFPDLRYDVELLVVEGDRVACRLRFDCVMAAPFMGLAPTGRRAVFCENVFYRFEAGRIVDVRSVIDREALARQLAGEG